MKVGIIGFGNMGSCLGEGFKSRVDEIWAFDQDKNKTNRLSEIKIAQNSLDLLNNVEVVVLAVKPQDFESILNEIKNNTKGKLIISIAAGITTSYIEKYLGNAKIVRTMPNLLAMIGKGITFLYKNKFAKDEDLNFAKNLFDSVGQTFILEDENMLDSATAVTGSGPGYYSDQLEVNKVDINNQEEVKKFNKDFIPSFVKSATSLGFEAKQATIIVEATILNTLELLRVKRISPGELAKQVASKGGTTEAAINVLHNGGSLEEAVKSARDRAKEISKK